MATVAGAIADTPDGRKVDHTDLLHFSNMPAADALRLLESTTNGLSFEQAAVRLRALGDNSVSHAPRLSALQELSRCARSPLNLLLVLLAVVSYLLGDLRAASVICGMVLLAIITAYVQEHRSNQAAAKLRAMVKNHASVRRAPAASDPFVEVPLEEVVPGDIVRLSAGDMLPGDVRFLAANDLFINQAALTGESMPSEKTAGPLSRPAADALGCPDLGFMGSNVVSGFGTALVLRTGPRTYFGHLARNVTKTRELTSFDRGINRFTWLMVRFMAVMVPAVFLINGFTKGDWLQALLFAIAVAVGLTPEMLPMIVTVNLAKGAMAMSSLRVIVKRLQAIQNFGAMDVLCTDKTGTLTQDRIILKKHLDLAGNESDLVLQYAYLNSYFQSGLKNLLDVAILNHRDLHALCSDYRKIDEIPFDFERRRLSIVLSGRGKHVLICKGAVEEVFAVCTHYEAETNVRALAADELLVVKRLTQDLNEDGFRVVAVAYKNLEGSQAQYRTSDECGLTLLGIIAFLDPPKESAGIAISALKQYGVTIKILTGDNDIVTRKVCHEVGVEATNIMLGADLDKLSDAELAEHIEPITVFAKLAPQQKLRVIAALQKRRHVVGFLGDGINDSAALKGADVGISVDSAVDIAKECADIILLDKNLLVLKDGVIEGRRVFGNISKYIKMGASSNFGNMFSVLGASLFLPFLPMTPIQVLTNNLLYDFSQTAIPTDRVDDEFLKTPRRWDIGNLFKFMIFLGPISSIFDFVTFAMLIIGFHGLSQPKLFQTAWFVESILTQTLIVHVIRTTKLPFVESKASRPLILTSIIVSATGLLLPFTRAGETLGFIALPWSLLIALLGIVLGYAVVAHLVKVWFARRWDM